MLQLDKHLENADLWQGDSVPPPQKVIQISPKIWSLVPDPNSEISWKSRVNMLITFWIIMLTYRKTDKPKATLTE